MTDLHDLELILRSDTPLLLIESLEEPRILDLFSRLALHLTEPAFCWSVTDGLRRIELDMAPQRHLAEPIEILRHVKVTPQRGIYLLLDFHPFLADPLHVRLVKEIAQGYGELPRTLVLVSHALEVPPEVRHLSARFRLRLPDRNRLLALIREEAQSWQRDQAERSFRANREAVDQLSRNLLGVTESDARRLIRNAIRNDGAITREDVEEVTRAKYELLSADGAVSFEYDTTSFAEVAGLENLKDWLDRRRSAFLGRTQVADQPKGIMLLGVQGGGKSLAAKAVAGCFGVPLLRLDFGALYDKYYGETEKNLKRALETADLMAPCVLWMDEIEKGLAGGRDDEAIGQRVMGSLLTWMAERRSAIFIVATANDISRLPPELVRKGRLDEIFFVDLPAPEVRGRIFEIHLHRRGLDPVDFDLDRLAAASEGFSGAGIEQAVVSALYTAHAQEVEVTAESLELELERTQPLSVIMDSQIEQLRSWAEGRTVPAH
ncbi:MAG: AAA family ATPase [Pseudomonadota bacterium]|nr:AAA family ATPase [Pseudomonadota bacterium]